MVAQARPIGPNVVEVFFHDKTRGIAGRYTANARWYQTIADIEKYVMERYDTNNYNSISPTEARHLDEETLTEMKPNRQRAKICYMVGKKTHFFYWEIITKSCWDDVTSQGFKEAKRRHKSARAFWYTEYRTS
jgi:hypothetical protein